MSGGAITKLLVCEGPEDKSFFEGLIQLHSLPRFCVLNAGGKGGFSRAINAFKIERTTTFNSLRNILIVGDNDETPQANFDNACGHIEKIFGVGSRPPAALVPVQRTATRGAEIMILMVPWTSVKGHLEKLCVEAARSADKATAANVDTFMGLMHAEKWNNESRYAKAWLRTSLAVRCERDPFVALGHIFNDKRNNGLIPLAHRSFDPIVEVLKGLK